MKKIAVGNGKDILDRSSEGIVCNTGRSAALHYDWLYNVMVVFTPLCAIRKTNT
jgi:hypothetical protein